jgi:D-glycero-beta-D-manno-heptose-7-phosphate kinase
MFTKEDLIQIFDSFNKMKILVIGDIMLDSYIWGKVDRISPEAPVPIVSIQKRHNRLGGAANVALNLKSLGAEPIICSVIGKDSKGEELMDVLRNESLSLEGIIKSDQRITTTKFRVFGNNSQMLRIDEEVTQDLKSDEENQLLNVVEGLIKSNKIEAIIFQDYNKGNLSKAVISSVIKLANEANIITTVDPKSKNFFEFKEVSLFKPNLKELQEGLNVTVDEVNKENLGLLAEKLKNLIGAKFVMATLSEYGIYIHETKDNKEQESYIIPAHKRSISDVSGAGDTVISVATLCLALKQSAPQIASLSNLAGGLVCEEVGVAAIQKERLLNEAVSILTKN